MYEVGRIGRGILKRAKVQLENVNTNVLGVILNNVKPDVAPDFYRYRTDYYYSDDDRGEKSGLHAPWREFVRQLPHAIKNFIGKMRLAPEAKGKRRAVSLFLLFFTLALVGLAWHNYPKISSSFQSRPDQKKFSSQNVAKKKPILPSSPATKKRTGQNRSAVYPAAQSPMNGSIEAHSKGQVLAQKEIKTNQTGASLLKGKEQTKPSGKGTEKQLTGEAVVVARTAVTGEKAITEDKPTKQKAVSPESSIEAFLEKWRRAWEEGDIQSYIDCYHSGFTSRGMDIQAWEKYKKDLFSRTPGRVVQISDIEIKVDGAIATATFKQRYETKNYKGYGLKTLQLSYYKGNWSILDESYESLPPLAEPVEVAIERFLEKWRLAWEEGKLETYISCYDPEFETGKMDFQDWKNHKRYLFARSAKRNVQISNMQIEPKGSNAVVTFTQSYQTANHRDLGTKTLHLRYDKDRWTILKENWRPLPYQG